MLSTCDLPSTAGAAEKCPSPKQSWWNSLKGIARKRTESQCSGADPVDNQMQWYLAQVKGPSPGQPITNADLISCLDFNDSGDLLATGDKAGRIVIFQRDSNNNTANETNNNFSSIAPCGGAPQYSVYCTFQSHEPEFDYLKSLEIEEKINQLRWLKRFHPAHFLLSTNDKTVKLWKVSERSHEPHGYNLLDDTGALMELSPYDITASSLRIPIHRPIEQVIEASPRRIYANAHAYNINSVSVNSDLATFISADDLRINLWHIECNDQSFSIVDLKPVNMEELTEVITSAEFHPSECHLFVYSCSKGGVRLCDMRTRAICDQYYKMFEEPECTDRSFFSEIISNVSDVKFSRNGQYFMSRDYMTLKIWDLRYNDRPAETISVHEQLRSKLCNLYESDCLFDKFECAWSPNDRYLMTGSYGGSFKVYDRETKHDSVLESDTDAAGCKHPLRTLKFAMSAKRKKNEVSADNLDFRKKILNVSWHPTDNLIAASSGANLYMFYGKH